MDSSQRIDRTESPQGTEEVESPYRTEGTEYPQKAEGVESPHKTERTEYQQRAEHTYATSGSILESPIFKMKIYGKECDVLFDMGGTVNILGRDTLVKHLGIPEKFIQGHLMGIKGISGQCILNQGNVQLPMEMMGYKSVESFAVLPELKFSFLALIGFRTMKSWGIVLDCRKQELSLQADMRH